MAETHLDPESLATLADGNHRAVPPRLWKHLVDCPACQATLVEAIRVQHAWNEGEARARIDPLLRAAAERIPGAVGERNRDAALAQLPETGAGPVLDAAAARASAAAGHRSSSRIPSRPVRPGPRWLRPLPLAAGTAVLLAGIVVVMQQSEVRAPDGSRERIENAILTASSLGMTLPGGAKAEDGPSAVYRGELSSDPALARDLEALDRRLARSPGSIEDYLRLIGGEIAAGQLLAARDLLDRVPGAYQGEPDLLVLRAVLAYRGNDVESAETHLRNAIRLDPDDPIARFDLAWILSEAGRRDEAGSEIDAVQRLAPGSPLARRAERLR